MPHETTCIVGLSCIYKSTKFLRLSLTAYTCLYNTHYNSVALLVLPFAVFFLSAMQSYDKSPVPIYYL